MPGLSFARRYNRGMASGEDVIGHLLQLDKDQLRALFLELDEEDRAVVGGLLEERINNPLYRFRGDHYGFVKLGLREGTWSKQDEVLQAVDKHKRVVVVATHSVGKSHQAARVVLGTGCTWPPGLARITTTATNYRQVQNILWPYIRRTHAQYQLPGVVAQSPMWKIGDELIGDGFSAAASDETATQGMHANGEMLLVVDEAGGISDTLGRAFNALLTNEDAHALVIGNAPTDRENSWFERITQEGSGWHVIRISAFDTPAFTGEQTDICTTCPPTIEQHRVAKHLTSKEWVDEVRAEFGPDSPFYVARVLAQFPRNATTKVLPMSWLEAATEPETTARADWVASIPPGPVRIGADIASDGGDELAVAWVIGLNGWVADFTSGPAISSAREAASFILNQIQLAEQYHDRHGITERVRVKLDAIGIGWGVLGLLEEYGDQGRHNAVIVGVDVAERASEPEKYINQRAEMWWAMREWIEPKVDSGQKDAGGQPVLHPLGHLHMGLRELAQLNAPTYKVRNGRIVIESKESMRKRGLRSPDRAESILLGFFEPPRKEMHVPEYSIELPQVNEWNLG